MSKRSVAYVKPNEPSFLQKLKREAGYVEGPTVDTKREALPCDSDSDDERREDEPTVVVLKPGDLTAEEAAEHEREKIIEEANAPADLSERVIFQKPINLKRSAEEERPKSRKSNSRVDAKKQKQLLSFAEDEEED